MENDAACVIFFDLELNLKFFSKRTPKTFRLLDVDIDKPFSTILPKLGDPGLGTSIIAAAVAGQSSTREIHTLSGTRYICSITPYYMEDDIRNGVILTFTDILDSKNISLLNEFANLNDDRNQKAITSQNQINDRQIRLIIESLLIPGCALDRYGNMRFVNAPMAALFGYHVRDLEGRKIDLLIPLDIREGHEALYQDDLTNLARRTVASGFHFEGINRDGIKLPLYISLSPIGTFDGPQILVIVHDLRYIHNTDAKHDKLQNRWTKELDDMRQLHELATRLVESMDLHAALADSLQTIMKLQNADFGILQLYDSKNGRLHLAAQKGFTPGLIQRFLEPSQDDESIFMRVFHHGKRVIIPDITHDQDFAPYITLAGEVGFQSMQISPINTRTGCVKGVVSTHFAQIHTPSAYDLQLSDLGLRMAADLIERAQSETELRIAQQAAEQANRIKTQFLAAAGHDLRQPLQVIGLLKAVLERQVISPQAMATLTKLGDALLHMQDLVESLVDANQIESGTVNLEIESLALKPLLMRLINDFKPAALTKGIELRGVVPPIILHSDRRLLTRLLNMLLADAIRHTENGKILVGCRRQGSCIRLEIWDTGISLSSHDLHANLSPLTSNQNDPSLSHILGLSRYIVLRFAAHLGYKVEIRSDSGKKNLFALMIAAAQFTTAPSATDSTPRTGDPFILLVEPDTTQREALDMLLQMEGFHTIAAADAAKALSCLAQIPPDCTLIIVAGADLPGRFNGIELVQHIRDTLRRAIPAVFLGKRKHSYDTMEKPASHIQFIDKPAHPATLLAAIESAFGALDPGWRHALSSKPLITVNMPAPASSESEIAIIDDEPGICDALRTILEAGGYKIETFNAAESYLADAKPTRFKCVLLDITLPGMSGLELQDRLNLLPDRPQLIFLTGNADLETVVRAMRNGAVDFMHKPVQGQALLKSVAAALTNGRTPHAEHAQHEDITRRLARLTRREREVLERVVNGELNKNIAADLGISERTTEHHRQSVMRKMEAKSLAMLVHMMSAARSWDERPTR